jgi:hypothetical protein
MPSIPEPCLNSDDDDDEEEEGDVENREGKEENDAEDEGIKEDLETNGEELVREDEQLCPLEEALNVEKSDGLTTELKENCGMALEVEPAAAAKDDVEGKLDEDPVEDCIRTVEAVLNTDNGERTKLEVAPVANIPDEGESIKLEGEANG